MAPIFNTVLKEVIKTCESEEGLKKQMAEKEKVGGFSLDSDSEEELVGIDVDTNFMDEKSSAIHCLGNLSLNCSGLMYEHMEYVCKQLTDELGFYFHENVRYHACLSLTQVAFGLLRLNIGKQDSDDKFFWKAGLPVSIDVPDQVRDFLTRWLIPHFQSLFEKEKDKEVIEKLLECYRDLAEEMGPGAVAPHIEFFVGSLETLLDK